MRNTIATYKESLSRIASDVLDDADDVGDGTAPEPRSQQPSPFSGRRYSRRFSQDGIAPVPNGGDAGAGSEVDLQRAEIQRLQASEAEIKALAVNYASILKEKEEQLSRLNHENSSLRKSLEAKNMKKHVPRDENFKETKNNSGINKGDLNQSPNKHQHALQVSSQSTENGVQNESLPSIGTFINGQCQPTFSGMQQNTQTDLASVHEENRNALAILQANYESEIKQLKMQLDKEHELSDNLKLKFQDAFDLNKTSKDEFYRLKLENERIMVEMVELQRKLDVKVSEISQLKSESNRRHVDEKVDDSFQNLKVAVATLEKDNATLKLDNDKLKAAMENDIHNILGKYSNTLESQMNVSSNESQKEKEWAESMQKLEKSLADTCKERDKAKRELARLKQHLLDKFN